MMIKSDSIDQLACVLVTARARIPEITKNKTVSYGVRGGDKKYSYADLPSILNVVVSALAEGGMMLSQPMIYRDGQQLLQTIILHASGQFLGSEMVLPMGLSPQDLGSVITYYRRYELTALLGISPEDDTDAEGVEAPLKAPTPLPVGKNAPKVTVGQAAGQSGKDRPASEAQKKMIFARLTHDLVLMDDDLRHDYLFRMTGKGSFQELTMSDVNTLMREIDADLKRGNQG